MSTTVRHRYERVLERGQELADLNSAGALVGWDQETKMPRKGIEGRSHVSATLAGILHDKITDPVLGEDLAILAADTGELQEEARALVREFRRIADRETRVPRDLVRALAEAQAKSTAAWAEARKANDFDAFLPHLTGIIRLKREHAEALGYADEPYDALLEDYEPGTSTATVAGILGDLRDELVPLVRSIAESNGPDNGLLAGPYDLERQDTFGREVVAAMGFDLEAGRLDLSEHPFTSGIHAGDVRLTTRYKDDLGVGLFGTIHEAGHGLYEQNLSPANRRNPLGHATSLGMHESQSRMWENMVGRGRPFWKHFFPRLRELFPERLVGTDPDTFYRAVNRVEPSLIRIEADEISYNLHIVIRFELEREFLSNRLQAVDLPEAWNAKYSRYLGITPPSPDVGVMQDIHWAAGLVGYFPTYSLGNLYAAQLYEAATRDIADLEERIAGGDLLPLRDWLVENVHRWGRTYSALELIERVTGRPFSAAAFKNYIRSKFGELYPLG